MLRVLGQATIIGALVFIGYRCYSDWVMAGGLNDLQEVTDYIYYFLNILGG